VLRRTSRPPRQTPPAASISTKNQPETPEKEPADFTPTERQQWTRFVTRMLDTLLPYREAYERVPQLIDQTLAENPSPVPNFKGSQGRITPMPT